MATKLSRVLDSSPAAVSIAHRFRHAVYQEFTPADGVGVALSFETENDAGSSPAEDFDIRETGRIEVVTSDNGANSEDVDFVFKGMVAGVLTELYRFRSTGNNYSAASSAVPAAAGTTQGTATALTAQNNAVTAADGTKGVVLPTAVAGMVIRIVNTVTTATLKVYPATGAAINSIAANSAFVLGKDKAVYLVATSATQWYTDGFSATTASVAEFNTLAGVTAGTAAASKAVVLDASADVTGIRNLLTAANGSFKVTGGSGAIGFATGAGAAVVQGTSKSTGVALNRPTGQITMHNASLASLTPVSFVLTSNAIELNDVVIVSIQAPVTANAYLVSVSTVTAGTCTITLFNASGGALTDAVILNFAVIKGVAA